MNSVWGKNSSLAKFWQFREFQTVHIFNSTFWLKMNHSALVCSYKQEKKDYIHLLTFTIYYQLETWDLLSYWLVSQRNYILKKLCKAWCGFRTFKCHLFWHQCLRSNSRTRVGGTDPPVLACPPSGIGAV